MQASKLHKIMYDIAKLVGFQHLSSELSTGKNEYGIAKPMQAMQNKFEKDIKR